VSETRQITRIFAATLVLGIAAFVLAIVVPPLLHGDLVVDSYEGKTYPIPAPCRSSTSTMCRLRASTGCCTAQWEAPLVFESRNTTSIQFVSIDAPSGTIGYAMDSALAVRVFGTSDTSVSGRISRLRRQQLK